MHILLVDDDKDSRTSVRDFLHEIGHHVTEANNGETALKLYETGDFPMVLSDIKMPKMTGLELLQAISSLPMGKQTDVVLFTGYGDMETAIAALRAGAYDYLLKPINIEELAIITEKIAEHQDLLRENKALAENFDNRLKIATQETQQELVRLKEAVAQSYSLHNVGIYSEAMQRVCTEALKYHEDRSIPVLIQGETGSGKEIIAKMVHFGNLKEVRPFVPINCAAVTPSLFESELFGYEPGAFTGGSRKGNKGKLGLANGGTLFLDEVGEIPLELQGKLLRVIQEKEYYRVGGLKKISADIRFLSATNIDLKQKVREGSFRKDLYYRLKVGHLVIPPLRERPDDIIPLSLMFLKEFSKQKGKNLTKLSKKAQNILLQYNWPGNVRELRNLMEWITFMYDDREVKSAYLSKITKEKMKERTENISEKTEGNLRTLDINNFTLPKKSFPVEKFMNIVIKKALDMHKGNKTETARYLAISRRSLYCRLQHLDEELLNNN